MYCNIGVVWCAALARAAGTAAPQRRGWEGRPARRPPFPAQPSGACVGAPVYFARPNGRRPWLHQAECRPIGAGVQSSSLHSVILGFFSRFFGACLRQRRSGKVKQINGFRYPSLHTEGIWHAFAPQKPAAGWLTSQNQLWYSAATSGRKRQRGGILMPEHRAMSMCMMCACDSCSRYLCCVA